MSQTSRCTYKNEYYDPVSKTNVNYMCPYNSHDSSELCELHDPTYLETHSPDESLRLFNLTLANMSSRQKLECIGFHLPNITLNNFSYPVYFIECVFHNDADFSNLVFYEYATFQQSVFESDCSFTGSEFQNDVSFFKVSMGENTTIDFSACNFLKLSDFTDANLQISSFTNAEFHDGLFRNTSFFQSTTFSYSIFKTKLDFSHAEFHDTSDFSFSEFDKVFFEETVFSQFSNFQNVIFHNQEFIFFNTNLSNVSFLNTDISRIKFGNHTIWNNKKTFEIFDDTQLRQSPSQHSLQNALAVYRNLRENYEFYLKYAEAGQFFVNEMELRRNYEDDENFGSKLKPICHRWFSLTSFYSHLCKYGEDFKRPAIWACLIFFGSVIFYGFFPDSSEAPISTDSITSPAGVLHHANIAVERTFSSLLPTDGNTLSDHVIKMLSIPVLGTLFIVLRRRFERRFRH